MRHSQRPSPYGTERHLLGAGAFVSTVVETGHGVSGVLVSRIDIAHATLHRIQQR
jgi:hypothetical protein